MYQTITREEPLPSSRLARSQDLALRNRPLAAAKISRFLGAANISGFFCARPEMPDTARRVLFVGRCISCETFATLHLCHVLDPHPVVRPRLKASRPRRAQTEHRSLPVASPKCTFCCTGSIALLCGAAMMRKSVRLATRMMDERNAAEWFQTRGAVKIDRAPLNGEDSRSTRPPARSIMRRTSARPIPLPSASVSPRSP